MCMYIYIYIYVYIYIYDVSARRCIVRRTGRL